MVAFINKKKQLKSYTYVEMNEKINSFSNILINELKHKKLFSCKVMIHASASIESAISMLSCAKLGILFSDLNVDRVL